MLCSQPKARLVPAQKSGYSATPKRHKGKSPRAAPIESFARDRFSPLSGHHECPDTAPALNRQLKMPGKKSRPKSKCRTINRKNATALRLSPSEAIRLDMGG